LNNLEDRTRSFAGTSKRCIGSEVPLEHVCSWSLVDRELTPMAEIAAREDAMRLESVLLRLPHDYGGVIELRFREDLAFAEIGRLMQRSEDAARMLLFRALERLQQILEGGHAAYGRPGRR
jgi:DNA-directed RNA polymerase specialized sigma24 family protein